MSTPSLVEETKKRSGWSMVMGFVTVALGPFEQKFSRPYSAGE